MPITVALAAPVSGGNLATVSALIKSGLNGGTWDGGGIVATMPAALAGLKYGDTT